MSRDPKYVVVSYTRSARVVHLLTNTHGVKGLRVRRRGCPLVVWDTLDQAARAVPDGFVNTSLTSLLTRAVPERSLGSRRGVRRRRPLRGRWLARRAAGPRGRWRRAGPGLRGPLSEGLFAPSPKGSGSYEDRIIGNRGALGPGTGRGGAWKSGSRPKNRPTMNSRSKAIRKN